jgi:hypothetical protein
VSNQVVIRVGVGFGNALAIAVSYATNTHIGWAILHGMMGWFYIVYCLLGYGR